MNHSQGIQKLISAFNHKHFETKRPHCHTACIRLSSCQVICICWWAAVLRRQWLTPLNSSPHGQNGHLFADDIFRYIFVNEKFCILIKISLKFLPEGPIDNNSALVQIMAWRRPGDKPLSEPMMVSLLTHICVTWLQWVNSLRQRQTDCHFADDIFKYILLKENCFILIEISQKSIPGSFINNKPTLVQIMVWYQVGDEPLSESMMA